MVKPKEKTPPKEPVEVLDDDELEEDDDDGTVTRGDIADIVDERLKAVLEDFGIKPATKKAAKEPAPVASGRATMVDVEDRVKTAVREEVDRIKEKDTIVGRIGKLEEKLVEQPPTQVRRLTRFLWGSD